MKLFPPAIEIADDEGFTADKDIFGRKALGDGLSNLVLTVDQPLVIALDAQWGSGKSTFLKMWAGELRKQDIGVVLFDAFENDFLDDAFTAIAGQIITLARDKNAESESRARRFATKAYKAGKVLARSAIKVGLKLGTVGALEAEDFKDISKDIGAEVSTLGDKYLGENLTKQKEQRAAIDEFRDALADLPGLLSPKADDSAAQKPLVIIIDELDRCKPSFALEILERIKHFFSVSNVHFVLGVHLGQLETSVKAAYGVDVDGKVYLQKFISFPVMLADSSRDYSEHSTTKYAHWIAKILELPRDDLEFYADFVARIARYRQLSLRTIEKIMTGIAMTIAFSSDRTLRPAAIVAGLCVIRVTDPSIYILAKTGDLIYPAVRSKLSLDMPPRENEPLHIDYISELWMYATNFSMPDDKVHEVSQYFKRYMLRDRSSLLPHVAGRVMDKFLPPT